MIELIVVAIDKLLAREQIKKFVEYCNSTELTDQMTAINSVLQNSSGETKDKLDSINIQLADIIDSFMSLMENTKDFITDATDLLEKMDGDLADKIEC